MTITEKANIIHKIWSNWYKYHRDNSTPENIERWNIQSETDFFELSDIDKQKDIDIVIKFKL